jgi:phosphoribosylanthranilate isomerase
LKPETVALLRTQHYRPFGVLPVRHEEFAREAAATYAVAEAKRVSAVVLDAYDPDREGGTGKVFCWDWVVGAQQRREMEGWPGIILAGGLRPENVAQAIRTVRPMGVDVSSGVEVDGQPGRKDPARMHALVEEARRAFLAL